MNPISVITIYGVLVAACDAFVLPFAATYGPQVCQLQDGSSIPEGGKFVRMNSFEEEFGPAAVLTGGLSMEQLEIVDDVVYGMSNALGIETPLVALTKDQLDKPLESILISSLEIEEQQSTSAQLDFAEFDTPVVLLSGFKAGHVKQFMAEFRSIAADGEEVAFAQAVPKAMSKTIEQLFEEIGGDHAAKLESRGTTKW